MQLLHLLECVSVNTVVVALPSAVRVRAFNTTRHTGAYRVMKLYCTVLKDCG